MGSDLFDLIVILLLVFFSLHGLKNGFLLEIGGIIALVGGFFTANLLHDTVSSYLTFISNPTVRMILTYLLIFTIFMLLVSVLVQMLIKALNKLVVAKWIDKVAGFLFGLLKGLLVCALLMVVLQTVFYNTAFIQNSRTLPYLHSVVDQLRLWMPSDLISRLKLNP